MNPLELEIQKPAYKKAVDFVQEKAYSVMSNKHVQAGLTTTALTTAVLAQDYDSIDAITKEVYGVGSGMIDGFLLLPNVFLNAFNDGQTWARDGTGMISNPNTGLGYWIGFWMMVSSESGISSSSSTVAKRRRRQSI